MVVVGGLSFLFVVVIVAVPVSLVFATLIKALRAVLISAFNVPSA